MHTVKFGAGTHISEAAIQLVDAAELYGEACGTFNEIELRASKGTEAAAVVASFNAQLDAREEAWNASPEGISYRAKQLAEIAAAQEKHDAMVAGLATLDFANGVAVLDWICGIQDATDHVGVNVARDQIISQFAAHGFEPNVNCGDAFKADDRENVLRWIVGQALDGLRSVAIHGIIHKFAGEWKSKFEN
jgi:hypothetical protein